MPLIAFLGLLCLAISALVCATWKLLPHPIKADVRGYCRTSLVFSDTP